MSLDEIRKKIGQLESTSHRRTLVGGIAVLIVLAGQLRALFAGGNLVEHIGASLTILGVSYLAYQLLLVRKKPANMLTAVSVPATGASFYREELIRQRDFHSGLWLWSRLLIFAPGPLVYLIGRALEHPEAIQRTRLTAVVFIVLCVLAVPLNLRSARKYQQELDALDGGKE